VIVNKRSTVVGLATGALLTASVVTAFSAQAATRNGVCESGEFCLYYNSNQQGSVSDFTTSISDYGSSQPSCYDFKGSGAGKGLCVKNHAASVRNNASVPVTIYFNSGYSGASQTIAPGTSANLNATLKNENASHKFGTPPSGKQDMSSALYGGLSGGRLTCPFDGYTTTAGRHEGIDFARSVDSPVRALVDGKVIKIIRGANGRGKGKLSTIAIYNAASDTTVIYLHTAPLADLREEMPISRGQQIATEAWRGVTEIVDAHTHVEVRSGRHTGAAKSVDDPVLNNPNPASFWNSQGYNVR
jgi:murein DD-endopeptidase MepM/ murein hydrolase activator NlpD